MLQRLLTSALLAGAAAGLIAALLQFVFVQPVLLQAELYESGERTHFAAASDHHNSEVGEAAEPAPATAEAARRDVPGIGFDALRDVLSILFTVLVYTGYGLLLVAALALAENAGHVVTARQGLIWGMAGFVAVQFAPAFGLAPELPGMAAADVGVRAVWWLGTVAATIAALWLIAFGRNWLWWAAAVVIALVPHLIGAPHPADLTGPTPPELAAQFAGRALGTGLVAWVLLGLFTTALWARSREA